MAPRFAILIVAVLPLVGACRPAATPHAADGASCRSCHEPHHADLGACVDCHRGNAATARKDLAHHRLLVAGAAMQAFRSSPPVVAGGRLVERAACRRCHRVGGEGNPLATDLDRAAWDRTQEDLRASITAPAVHMPRFGFTLNQADEAIAYLLNVRRPGLEPGPYRVHFTTTDERAASAFESQCGRCHRALTQEGALGSPSGGANLSGLLTPFYPRTAAGQVAWSAPALRDWIRNPRAARPGALMPPLRLTELEVRQVVAQLGGRGGH